MTPAPWGEHPALPPRLRVVRVTPRGERRCRVCMSLRNSLRKNGGSR